MGYELNRLMQQYGVSTPGRVNYSGPTAPNLPTEPVEPDYSENSAIKKSAKKVAYNLAKEQYDLYKTDPSAWAASAEGQKYNEDLRKYNLAQREYNTYRQDYQKQLGATPMYSNPQFGNLTASDLFNRYATGYTPDQEAIDYWNAKLKQQGGTQTVNQFLNPTDPNAPRMGLMREDPSYKNYARTGAITQWDKPLAAPTFGNVPASLSNMSSDEQADYLNRLRQAGYTNLDYNALVPQLYREYLGRDPESGSIAVDWARVGGTEQNIRDALAASDEYKSRFGVRNLYQNVLGRDPEDEGMRYWASQFGPSIDPNEINTFVESAQREAPGSYYKTSSDLFNRYAGDYSPDQTTLDYWNNLISTQGWNPTVNKFLNPSDLNAPRYPVMQTDPEYLEYLRTGVISPWVRTLNTNTINPNAVDTSAQDQLTQDTSSGGGGGSGGFIGKIGRSIGRLFGWAEGGSVHDLAQKYNVGGAVRRYRFGGDEGEPTDEVAPIMLASAPTVTATDAAPVTASPAAQPVMPPTNAPTPVSPAAADLNALMNRYLSAESAYGPELKAARSRLDTESKAFENLVANAIKGDTAAPDKTEMYFRLAAAFGSPSKTGRFTENLALAGKEMADYAKDVRAAKKAERALQLQMGLEAQKLKMQGARDELTTLRTLAGEEMKDKRAILQEYIKSGRPQSEAGKAAVDAGLTQGTPEFATFVEKYIDDKIRSGNLLKEAMVAIAAGGLQVRRAAETRAAESAKKLTAPELKLKSETEDRLTTIDNALKDLSRAYDLNKDSFDTTLKDRATMAILQETGSKDPKVLNTRELSNLLKSAMISSASEKLKGVLSDSDIKLLQSVAGLDAKSREERAQILKNAYRALKSGRVTQQKRLNEISQGLYRETSPATATGEVENE